MKFSFVLYLGLAASFLTPTIALAADQPLVTFRLPGVQFSMPMPDGYCLPSGDDVDVAQLVAAGDTVNTTHVTVVKCGDRLASSDYFILKTPVQALLMSINRQEFLEMMKLEFAKPEMQAIVADNEIADGVAKDFENIMHQKIEIDSQVGYRGGDDACVYLGGYASYTNIPEPYQIALGMCMTTVEGKMININVYGPPEGSDDVSKLMARARDIALSIEAVSKGEP